MIVLSLYTHDWLAGCLFIISILVAYRLHEWGHGLVARWVGDKLLAESLLTFHLVRPVLGMGALFFLLFGVGWSKSTEINQFVLKHPRRESLFFYSAGILMNLLTAGFLVALLMVMQMLEILPSQHIPLYEGSIPLSENSFFSYLMLFLSQMAAVNLILALVNLIPAQTMDGEKIVLSLWFRWVPFGGKIYYSMFQKALLIIVLLGLGLYWGFADSDSTFPWQEIYNHMHRWVSPNP